MKTCAIYARGHCYPQPSIEEALDKIFQDPKNPQDPKLCFGKEESIELRIYKSYGNKTRIDAFEFMDGKRTKEPRTTHYTNKEELEFLLKSTPQAKRVEFTPRAKRAKTIGPYVSVR